MNDYSKIKRAIREANTMGYGEIGKIKMDEYGYWKDSDGRFITIRINTIEEE